ncbi:MAG: hypothetical protein PVI86_09950 [Phycisphaerae bacterium]|jgi:hypothetical protein
MIEFKAECGHTVRAKDEDAGGVVRCSYCGRKSTVPDEGDGDLDFLFADVESGGGKSAPAGRRRPRRSRRLFGRRARPKGPFNPFSLVLRMCYAALLICIVVFVARKFIIPAIRGVTEQTAQRRPVSPRRAQDNPSSTNERGLSGISGLPGLYVASFPPNAEFYVISETKMIEGQRISQLEGHVRGDANTSPVRLPQNEAYAVDVMLPTNDPRLNDRTLPYYEEYRKLRRALRSASEEEARQLLEAFFVPDEAWPVELYRFGDRSYIVRQYRAVEVDAQGRSNGVRALFLPKIEIPGRSGFSISKLVTDYLPKAEQYVFDEVFVADELDFYGVPEADRAFVLAGLQRAGIMPFVKADETVRLVKLGIHDGDCWDVEVRESLP